MGAFYETDITLFKEVQAACSAEFYFRVWFCADGTGDSDGDFHDGG